MSLTDQIKSALKTNIVDKAGRWTSVDGIVDITYIPDEGVGYVDMLNPGRVVDKAGNVIKPGKFSGASGFRQLVTRTKEVLKSLPPGEWECNPDDWGQGQKGDIYGKIKTDNLGKMKPNPKMPNNAWIFDNTKSITNKAPEILSIINPKNARALGLVPFAAGAAKSADVYVAQDSARKFKENPNIDTGVQATLDAAGIPDPTPIANVLGLGWSNKDWIARNIGQAVEGIKEKASYINPDHPGPPPEIPQAVVNRNGMVELIKQFEGFRSDAYHHTGDVPTIGYGNTQYLDGTPVKLGDTISESDADALMGQTVDKFWGKLKENPHIKKLPPNAQAAIGSFAYNVGPDFFDHPGFTTITKAIKGGDLNKIGEAMQLYVNPGTQFEDGLRRRREAERQLLLKP